MKKPHILSIVFLAAAVSSPAVPSGVGPTEVESFALDKSETGYTVEYDATPQIATYAEIVYRTYRDSLAMAELMQTAIADLLAAPSEKTLAAARRTWINARLPYSRTEAFRFYQGPIDFVDAGSGEEGPEGRINAWPLNEAFIDSVRGNAAAGIINADLPLTLDNLLGKNQISDEADVTTGWHAIEFLLWGQDFNADGPGVRAATDFIPPHKNAARRAQYLRLITDLLVSDLRGLVAEWAPGRDNYRADFVALPQRQALGRILTGMGMLSAFEMGLERMGVALDSGDTEDEQSCFSDNTHNDFAANQSGIMALYFGLYGDYQGAGLDALARRVLPVEASHTAYAVIAANSAIADMHKPFDLALSQKNDAARRNAERAVEALQRQGTQFQRLGRVLGARVVIGE